MLALKPSLSPPHLQSLFPARRRTHQAKNSIIRLSKSDDSEPERPKFEGDTRRQELLARIAILQAQKVRLTDYLDERSEYLTQFAEEAGAEFDKVGEDALKGLEEASERIMGNIESRMQAFEESQEQNRMEIEESEDKLAQFEGQMVSERNEGMFFKSLGQQSNKNNKTVDEGKAKEEAAKIKEVTKENIAGSKTRRNVYLALMALLVVGIADSFVSSVDWRKVAVLGAILIPLFFQFIYEQKIVSEAYKQEREKTDDSKQ